MVIPSEDIVGTTTADAFLSLPELKFSTAVVTIDATTPFMLAVKFGVPPVTPIQSGDVDGEMTEPISIPFSVLLAAAIPKEYVSDGLTPSKT
jgi:hypothetical protein